MKLNKKIFEFYDDYIFPVLKWLPGAEKLLFYLSEKALHDYIDSYDPVTVELKCGEIKLAEEKDFNVIISEKEYLKNFIDRINSETVVADVGSYHGLFALIGANGKKGYAFEIDSENAERIEKNIELNPDKEVHLIKKAVWEEETNLDIQTGMEQESHIGEGGENKENIETVVLDDFFEDKEKPDIIKIDVEGSEGQVLKGAESILENYHPILFIEFHVGDMMQRFDHSYEELKEFLQDLDYNFSFVKDRWDQKLVVAE